MQTESLSINVQKSQLPQRNVPKGKPKQGCIPPSDLKWLGTTISPMDVFLRKTILGVVSTNSPRTLSSLRIYQCFLKNLKNIFVQQCMYNVYIWWIKKYVFLFLLCLVIKMSFFSSWYNLLITAHSESPFSLSSPSWYGGGGNYSTFIN